MPKLRCSYNLSSLLLLCCLYVFLYIITCLIQLLNEQFKCSKEQSPFQSSPQSPVSTSVTWDICMCVSIRVYFCYFSVENFKCESDVAGWCSHKMMLKVPIAYVCVSRYCVTYKEPDLLQRRRRFPAVHCSQNCTWILPQDKLFSLEKWTNT